MSEKGDILRLLRQNEELEKLCEQLKSENEILSAKFLALRNAIKVKMKPGRKPTLGDYCFNGHLRTPQSCGRNKKGALICRTCSKASFKRFMEKNKR